MYTRSQPIGGAVSKNTITNNYPMPLNQNLTRSPDSDQLYTVNMQVKYKTQNGQKLAISGNIPELGMWKKFNFQMKAVDGTWITESPIITKKRYFQYKYVLLNADGSLCTWERGVDRIADLDILPDLNQGQNVRGT